jgi:hypothetical protein
MVKAKIVKVRLSGGNMHENITHVKIDRDSIEGDMGGQVVLLLAMDDSDTLTVREVLNLMNSTQFYIDNDSIIKKVDGKLKTYIRASANGTDNDNLLTLPKF